MMLPSVSYPSKFAARRSENKERERWRRLTGQRSDPRAARWATVKLTKRDGKWFLTYSDGERTGGFASLQKAVSWYADGGR